MVKHMWNVIDLKFLCLNSETTKYTTKPYFTYRYFAEITVGPRWAPFWPHKPCYQGSFDVMPNTTKTVSLSGCRQTHRTHHKVPFENKTHPLWFCFRLGITLLISVYGIHIRKCCLTGIRSICDLHNKCSKTETSADFWRAPYNRFECL